MANTLEIFRKIILQNELGGDPSCAYKFSDPDGVRSGKSGWSFGLSQFDTQNNPLAILCLRECGFITDEIMGVRAQTVEIGPLDLKLFNAAHVIDRYDDQQIRACLSHPSILCSDSGILLGPGALYHLADYHNQFYMSPRGKMHRFVESLGRPVLPEDILEFKLATAWGGKRPDDVRRRFRNIVDILQDSL